MSVLFGPVIVGGVTLTAGAADVTSDSIAISPSGGLAAVWLVNGATGPTVAAQVQAQISFDGVSYANHDDPVTGSTAASATVSDTIELPGVATRARFICGSNTDQNVTVTVHALSR